MGFLLFWFWCPAISLAVGEIGCYRPTYPREVNPWRAQFFSVPVAIEGVHLLIFVLRSHCSQVQILVKTTSTQMSFPETVSDSSYRNSSVEQIHSFISYPAGWFQMIPQVKKPNVEVLGWRGYTWSAVKRPVRCTAKFYKTAYGSETNIQFFGNSSGGNSCTSAASWQNSRF